jgi:hypothetical protein
MVAASFKTGLLDYLLKNRFILDSGSTIHITNDKDRIHNLRPPDSDDYLWAGNSQVWIQGYGTIQLCLVSPKGMAMLELQNAAWCPDILCNLVSFRQLRHQGIWWDTKSEPTQLRQSDNTTITVLDEQHDQWVLKEPTNALFAVSSRNQRSPQKVNALLWHKRMGHPGPAVIEHLVQQSEGVRIKGITTVQCDACGRAKTKRQISRAPRQNDEGPGERIAIDFHSYEEGSFTKEKSQLLATDCYSGFLWDFYFKDNRMGKSIIHFLDTLVRFLYRQYQIQVKVIECDGEITATKLEVA